MKSSGLPAEARASLWCALLSAPLMWSASTAGSSHVEAVSYALSLLFLGTLPCLAVALSWPNPSTAPRQLALLRYGASRRGDVLVSLLRMALALFATAAVLTTWTVLVHYGSDVRRLLSDLSSSLVIACASSLALVCFFACMRAWLGKLGLIGGLTACWALASENDLALVLPLTHVRALLLANHPPRIFTFELSGWMSLGFLYLLAAIFFWLLMIRVPR